MNTFITLWSIQRASGDSRQRQDGGGAAPVPGHSERDTGRAPQFSSKPSIYSRSPWSATSRCWYWTTRTPTGSRCTRACKARHGCRPSSNPSPAQIGYVPKSFVSDQADTVCSAMAAAPLIPAGGHGRHRPRHHWPPRRSQTADPGRALHCAHAPLTQQRSRIRSGGRRQA